MYVCVSAWPLVRPSSAPPIEGHSLPLFLHLASGKDRALPSLGPLNWVVVDGRSNEDGKLLSIGRPRWVREGAAERGGAGTGEKMDLAPNTTHKIDLDHIGQ